MDQHDARGVLGMCSCIKGCQIGTGRVPKQLHTIEAKPSPEAFQIRDATREGHPLDIAEWSLAAAALVVVREAELVGPGVADADETTVRARLGAMRTSG
jgi:hypothetical protein